MFGSNAFGQPYFGQGPLSTGISGTGSAALPNLVADGDGLLQFVGVADADLVVIEAQGQGTVINPVVPPVGGDGGTGRVGTVDEGPWEVMPLKPVKVKISGRGTAALPKLVADTWGFIEYVPKITGTGGATLKTLQGAGQGKWQQAKWQILEDEWLLGLIRDLDLVEAAL
jgi:hypothetical protein